MYKIFSLLVSVGTSVSEKVIDGKKKIESIDGLKFVQNDYISEYGNLMVARDDLMVNLGDNKSKMLLQIHDELIFEVDEGSAEVLAEKFKTIMEDIMTLNIPLKASMNIGDNWSELK